MFNYLTIKLNLPKNYGVNEYFKRLLYLSKNNDLAFQNLVIDVINNREDLQKFLLATSDFGKTIEELIITAVTNGKLNNIIVRQTLDLTNEHIFDIPNPLKVTFKDIKKFDAQNPIIVNLLS